jgi:hypothetical protein
MTNYIYDNSGKAVGFWRDRYVYALSGKPIGQLRGTNVHTLRGTYVGELYKDTVVDMHRGNPGNIGSSGNPGNPGSPPRRSKHFSRVKAKTYLRGAAFLNHRGALSYRNTVSPKPPRFQIQ